MKPKINLLHLKYFCDALVCDSISEAAKMNFVTLSAVSQGIAKLEITLGVSLLNHSRQKFEITEEGRIVFDQSVHIFKAVDDIYDKINQNKECITGSLKFVSTNSLGMSFIGPSYRKMKENFPHIDIGYQLGHLNFIRNTVRQGNAEFAIVVYDQDFSLFNKKLLRKGSFHLYQSVHAPLALIEKGILIDHAEGMHVDVLRNHYAESGRGPIKIQAELAGWEVVARFTEMNIGIGFFPDYILENNRYPTLKSYPVELPPVGYEICAIYNKGTKLSRVASAFLNQFSLD